MKIKIVIITGLTAVSYLQISGASSSLQNAISVFDTAQGYEAPGVATARYAQYKASMSQIATNLANKEYAALQTDFSNAAYDYPDLFLQNLFNGGPLSLANLQAAGFDPAEIQTLGVEAGLQSSEAFLYANKGLSPDSNYDNIVDMFWNGISASNTAQVTNALKLLNNDDYASDPFIAQLKAELAEPLSSFNEQLTSAKFSPAQIKQICESAGIDPVITQQIYELNSFFDQSITNLSTTISSGNVEEISALLTGMSAAKPNLTAELFQNGEPLDQAFLSKLFPTQTDLANILQSAGLQKADIANYIEGEYTGPSSITSGPSGPTGPVEPKTPSDPSAYEQLQNEIKAGTISMAQVQSELANTRTQITKLQQQLANAESDNLSEDEISEIQQNLAQEQSYESTYNEIIDNPVDPVV